MFDMAPTDSSLIWLHIARALHEGGAIACGF
jgi:hypothetical protein